MGPSVRFVPPAIFSPMTSETLQDKTEHQTPKDILVEMMNTLPPQMEYNYLMNDSLMLNQQQQSIPSTAQPLLQQTNPMLQQQVISNHQQMITPTQPVLQNSMQPLQNQLQQTGMQNQLQQSNIQTGLQPAQIQTSIQNFENPVYENQQVNQLQSVQLPIQQNLQQPIQSPLSTSLPPSSLQPPILPSVQQGIIQTQVIAQPVMQMQPNMMPMQQNLGISILPDQFTILEEKSTEAKVICVIAARRSITETVTGQINHGYPTKTCARHHRTLCGRQKGI
ncbi:hypothetical protein EDD86DRAFT_61203 [Gorgonomyces haynaldii]|nr:hypothetical protein EDD86DRAFT_61203 [Gorgonomyces haynaldii]